MSRYLIVCSDLIFTSKVAGTAQMLGMNCQTVMSGAKAESVLAESDDFTGMVIDLNTPGLILESLVGSAPAELKARTVAFGPHVDVDKLKLAKEVGCAAVFTRGQFTSELPQILKQIVAAEGSAQDG